jgi:hypothetical protein
VAALAVALLLVVLALVREARLRRALERLVAKLLAQWRKSDVKTQVRVAGRRGGGQRRTRL